jgi:phage tail sheath protein FI
MPEYLSPGVYVEEVDAGPKPIEGVSTSTAGAVGVTERGPTEGRPLLVTSFAQFQRDFGELLKEPTDPAVKTKWTDVANGGHFWRFGLAIKGFFDNGGQRMFVQRVVAKAAVAAEKQLDQGFYLDIARPVKAGPTATVIRLAATAQLCGIAKDSRLLLTTIDGAVTETVTVLSYDAGANEITLTAPVTNDLTPGNWLVGVDGPANIPPTMPPPGNASVFAAPAPSLKFVARSKGEWGNDLRVRVRPMTGGVCGLLGHDAVPNNAGARTTVAATAAATIDLTSGIGFGNGDKVKIKNEIYTLSNRQEQTAIATLQPAPAGIAAGDDVFKLPGAPTTALTIGQAANNVIQVPTGTGLANGNKIVIGDVVYTLSNAAAAGANTNFDIAPVAAALLPATAPVFLVPAAPATTAAAPIGPASIGLAAPLAQNDRVVIGAAVYTIAQIAQAVRFDTAPAPSSAVTVGTPVVRLRLAVDPTSATTRKQVFLTNVTRLYEDAVLEFDNGVEKFRTSVLSWAGRSVTLADPMPVGKFVETDLARIIEARVEVQYQADPSQPPTLETFEFLRLKNDQTENYLVDRINQRSQLVRVEATQAWEQAQPDLSTFPAAPVQIATPVEFGGWVRLQNGDDQVGQLAPDDFIGEDLGPGRRTGLYSLDDVDEISILLAPGIWSDDVRRALVEHCELLKDRFAIVDSPPAEDIDIAKRIDPETIKVAIDSKYGAVYYPWLIGRDFVARRDVKLPPSAHLAGIYARSDVERGVHKAPANEVVRGIDRFEIDISKREQDMLNPKGVNALRSFPGRGNRVWGARTLSSDGSWKYVNVRRLFNYVEESIDEGTQWVVFEPNDERLWARVRQTINQFLDRLWREGMLFGATRAEAYFVKCDRTTMTQDDIDNGRLICVIGIAPVKPAEFVIFRIQQKTLEQKA